MLKGMSNESYIAPSLTTSLTTVSLRLSPLSPSLTVSGESMEGENKVECDACGAGFKVAAIKLPCISLLPPLLVVHLKRFAMDYDTWTAYKVKKALTLTW